MIIGLIINKDKLGAIECGKEIIDIFKESNTKVIVDSMYKGILSNVDYADSTKLIVLASDVVVTVGGDGTIIDAGKYAAKANKPLLGVNLGRIGFVAGLERDELFLLRKIVSGDYRIQKRMLIDCTVHSKGYDDKTYVILNEVTLQRDLTSSMVEIDIELNDEKIINYRADGIIFATATGSTAYSLSAGGPVLEPDMECILVNPLCPHSLSSRPVVFSPNAVLNAKMIDGCKSKCFLSVDGQHVLQVQNDSRVEIKKSELTLDLIILKEKNFYTLLNEKLKEEK